jgi:hypothetical protein
MQCKRYLRALAMLEESFSRPVDRSLDFRICARARAKDCNDTTFSLLNK